MCWLISTIRYPGIRHRGAWEVGLKPRVWHKDLGTRSKGCAKTHTPTYTQTPLDYLPPLWKHLYSRPCFRKVPSVQSKQLGYALLFFFFWLTCWGHADIHDSCWFVSCKAGMMGASSSPGPRFSCKFNFSHSTNIWECFVLFTVQSWKSKCFTPHLLHYIYLKSWITELVGVVRSIQFGILRWWMQGLSLITHKQHSWSITHFSLIFYYSE